NNLPPDLDPSGTFDAPRDLSVNTVNIIKLYQDSMTGEKSFVKRQCMHCVDPTCVSGCPTSALIKEKDGIVSYDKDACCGCRYCQMNCPFNIPKFQFDDWYGEIKKCGLCRTTNLVSKGQPGCTEACPTGAVIYGKVKELLKEAKQRLKKSPEHYVNYIYGEKDGGGTSVLYLSKVPFEKLGLPTLPEYSQASIQEGIQHKLYQYLALPGVVYAALAGIAYKNRSGQEKA
ncbi:MAG: hydrogenase 2 operon protein HybA, partial [SAR324 cluster bacterium]|nr:hydrogenase 2 operon protein HybA [SAR324 cluster bacterium]